MIKNFQQDILFAALFFTVPIGSMFVGIDTKPAFADCNLFGCSQSSVAECNPFGCPKPPSGKACTPFGCPESPQPLQVPSSEQPNSEQPNSEQLSSEQLSSEQLSSEQLSSEQSSSSENPQVIQQCMEKLLYRTEEQKPFPQWICVPNDVNCRTVRVRTEISENAAVQLCQGLR